jgi:hypothetical protein
VLDHAVQLAQGHRLIVAVDRLASRQRANLNHGVVNDL